MREAMVAKLRNAWVLAAAFDEVCMALASPEDTVLKPAPYQRCITEPVVKDGKVVGCSNGGFGSQEGEFLRCDDTFRLASPDDTPEAPAPPAHVAVPAATSGRYHWSCWAYLNVPNGQV